MPQTHHLVSTSTSGSRTESSEESTASSSTTRISATLRLRAEGADNPPNPSEHGGNQRSIRRIQWRDDVIDNEGMGRKSSKVCCIYHKARPVGESSSESESSDSSDSESDSDSDADNLTRGKDEQQSCRDGSCNHERLRRTAPKRTPNDRKTKVRKPSPNAYERMSRTTRGH
ncbi:PPP1R11/YPI1 family protein [Aspergillus saccharolyticus JOP 1030-1]|uniref:Type 1 phosphatases regulator n=1 Tax=Aspergillus saccharolyticus JOP 1030-1 TaxID=1450539 RepID=A0A318ZJE7_9EURO|nr:hypothetical protein BP01DRAFT_313702 [Aspergillus saccharolyticus JOP 1030-1]PYH47701.1 hypothetical protein BP01DRAFT_313702 [Aspergillus saccharolyticus JOP 1030-1]